ncbi:SDR family NAD(P)-dependent oxidoreductase [Streptomyces klenkii]
MTGASSGLGAGFARRLAREGYDLILVARDEGRLQAFADELARDCPLTAIEAVSADLATPEGRRAVVGLMASAPVDLLVNNAGMGYATPATSNTIDQELRLVQVNAVATLELTLAALHAMRRRGRGSIINVASVAAVGPSWLDSTYGASKACVLRFSEDLGYSERVRAAGVRVMALLPGNIRTEFHERAGIPERSLPMWRYLTVDKVVDACLRDLAKGKAISTPSARYKVLKALLHHLPRRVSASFAWDCGVRESVPVRQRRHPCRASRRANTPWSLDPR